MDLLKASLDSLDISDTEESFFNLAVSIFEGHDFVWLDTPTQVIVKFGQESKQTAVHPPTKNPCYNEYFVFDFSGLFSQLLDIPLIIKVVLGKAKVGMPKKLLASARFDLATIWLQPNHFISRKLIVLTHPNDPKGDIKGYILCDLGITSTGVPQPKSFEPFGKPTTVLKGDYFSSSKLGSGKLKALYSVQIYRAIGLNVSLEEITAGEISENLSPKIGKQKVRVYFAGLSGTTSNRYKRRDPTWNEEIVFTEMFPPLYSRIKIDLFSEKKTSCSRYINLFKISDPHIKGFLPTFGPSFLHLYCPVYEYFGSLLISVRTVTVQALPEKSKLVAMTRGLVNPLDEPTYWNTEEFVAFAMVNNVTSIDKHQTKQKLVFSMCIGDNERNPYNHLTNHFLCPPQETVACAKGNCCHVKDSEVKLTFFIKKALPDTRHRLFLSNCLDKLSVDLATRIEKAYSYSESDEAKATAILMSGIVDFLRASSRIQTKEMLAFTRLQKERIKIVKDRVTEVQEAFESREFKKANINEKLKLAAKLCRTLMRLVDDPQDNFPLLIFKVYAMNREVLAYTRFSLREIVFSTEEYERGRYCGVIQMLNLKHVNPNDNFFGRMEVYLWFGLHRSVGFALQNLPTGYEDISSLVDLPRTITYKVHNIFTFRAHIHQGFFLPCDDTQEGLCSSSVNVFVGAQVVASTTLPKTVSPLWETTLLLENVKIYGELSFLKEHPPPVVVEIHNLTHLPIDRERVVGRFVTLPFIYMSQEDFGMDYPPPLSWYKVTKKGSNVGELLAMFELIHRECVVDGVSQYNSTIVPELREHIHPKTNKYRMEILFWGIRDATEESISNPAVKIDFGKACFTSQVLQNLYQFPNFNDDPQFAEVEIPENILFFPPLVIRLYDGRSFGTSQFVGKCVFKNIHDLKLELAKKKYWEKATSEKTASALSNLQKQRRTESLYAWPNIIITGRKTVEEEDDDEGVPLIEQLSKDGPKMVKIPESMDQIRQSALTRLKSLFRKKKLLLQTSFDDEGNIITTGGLTDRVHKNDPDYNYKLFDWWTKYFEAVQKLELKYQHRKVQSTLAVEEEELSVTKTAIELLKAFGQKKGKKESVVTSWSGFKSALSMKCRIPFLTKSKSTTIGGKLELDAENLLKSLQKDDWKASKLMIFEHELEKVPHYEMFEDVLRKFPIRKGSTLMHKESPFSQPAAYLKVGLSFYKMDEEQCVTQFGGDAREGVYSPFTTLLKQEIPLIVRVYVVRAHNLKAFGGDLNPYIQILTPSVTLSDKGRIFLGEKSPMLGRKFELKAKLPYDSSIVVRLMDWDKYSEDDVIGDTIIDIENRFFSRHRGSCGLPERYNSEGYNRWRDIYKPSEILESLCASNNLPLPVYTGRTVEVAGKAFKGIHTDIDVKECAALAALNHWDRIPVVGCKLVQEHVETRPIFKPDSPGIEQGKVELWVDIIPELEDYHIPPPVDFKLRDPEDFELRVIAWQTKKIMRKDPTFFTMSRHVDIFLSAWIEGKKDKQTTDVHFSSTKGHGQFNWRFIFNFYYYRAEKLIVPKTKIGEEPGKKRPAVVYMQVYDKERFRADDPIGELAIDLNHIPRPELHLLGTNLYVLNKVITHTIDIFTDRKLRGWYPFTQFSKKGKGPLKIVGYVDLEFNLLYRDEAIANPAGLGRDDPNPMPVPIRPKVKLTVMRVLLSPFRKACYVLFKYHKLQMLKCALVVFGTMFGIVFLINVPKHLAGKLFGP